MKSLQEIILEKLKIRKSSISSHESYKYFPTTINELRNIIEKLADEQSMKDVINLNSIDTSEITDMTYLFNSMEGLLKIDVSDWDVSNVTSMNNMFRSCVNLEKIIGIEDWDVSNVKNMQDMFRGCEAFNQDLSKWDVSKVTNKSCMFFYCPIEEKYKPKFK
jgi:surface protein